MFFAGTILKCVWIFLSFQNKLFWVYKNVNPSINPDYVVRLYLESMLSGWYQAAFKTLSDIFKREIKMLIILESFVKYINVMF